MIKHFAPTLALLAAGALALAACATSPAASDTAAKPAEPAATTAPANADSAAPATEAAAPAADAATSQFAPSTPAVSITTPEKPWILDSFERVTADGKIQIGEHPTANWVNLSDAGWGGWKSSGFALSSSTEHATEGSHSMLVTINGKVSSRSGSGACFGMNWENDGPTAKDKVPLLRKAAYVVLDYTWEPSDESTVSNPWLGFNLHANGTDDTVKSQAMIGGDFFYVTKGSGTVVIKLTKGFNDKVTRMPQFSLKVFTAFIKGDENKMDPAESGKKLKGNLWLDNLRFADANGVVLSL